VTLCWLSCWHLWPLEILHWRRGWSKCEREALTAIGFNQNGIARHGEMEQMEAHIRILCREKGHQECLQEDVSTSAFHRKGMEVQDIFEDLQKLLFVSCTSIFESRRTFQTPIFFVS